MSRARKVSAGRAWSADESRAMVSLAGQGMPYAEIALEIARRFGRECQGSAIGKRLRRLGYFRLAPYGPATVEASVAPGSKPNNPATRTCLSCGDPFESEWSGHRICGKCKDTEAWQAGIQDHGIAAHPSQGVA